MTSPVDRTPRLIPIPLAVEDVARPVISLEGTWRVGTTLAQGDVAERSDNRVVIVPGELAMQGFPIEMDREYYCARTVHLPSDYVGCQVILRFDGVYSTARVWVNGHFVGEHQGGFTAFDFDITAWVEAGQMTRIVVGVTDQSDSIAHASAYAKHPIGGILRSVRVFAVPVTHVTRFHCVTEIGDEEARLTVGLDLPQDLNPEPVHVEVALYDPDQVLVGSQAVSTEAGVTELRIPLSIPTPVLWTAETPALYQVRVVVGTVSGPAETLTRAIGIRSVTIDDHRLYVNGQPVKLRGINRHDMSPGLGRSTDAQLDEEDLRLFRAANINYVRTSHYPPSEAFLDAADRLGMFVEEEAAVCFQLEEQGQQSFAQPAALPAYLQQFAEMIERDRDHASVIIWSLGNESSWGANFAAEYAYAKAVDPSRPVMFSFADRVPDGVQAYDIYSNHYPDWSDDLGGLHAPVIHDECAHIACYNLDELRHDPGVREAWGASVKAFWDRIWATDRCAGAAIWAGIDEVFLLPTGPVGYGEWGILDIWRRPKPEYWWVKKAYSPVVIPVLSVEKPSPGQPLAIPIHNRFDHMNLTDLTVEWTVGSEQGRVVGPSVAPHDEGLLYLEAGPSHPWQAGDIVRLAFYSRENGLVDACHLGIGSSVSGGHDAPIAGSGAWTMEERPSGLMVKQAGFQVQFDRAMAEPPRLDDVGSQVGVQGPTLYAPELAPTERSCTPLKVFWTDARTLVAEWSELAEAWQVTWRMTFSTEDSIVVNATLATELPLTLVREFGLAFAIPSAFDRLHWYRDITGSEYPPDHIGRPSGVAEAVSQTEEAYRRPPWLPWSQDTRNFFLGGRQVPSAGGTYDFRATKFDIQTAWLSQHATGMGFVVRRLEDPIAVRMVPASVSDGTAHFLILWAVSYPELGWGNWVRPPLVIPAGSTTWSIRLGMGPVPKDRG